MSLENDLRSFLLKYLLSAKACLVLKEPEFDDLFETVISNEDFLCHVIISDDTFMLDFFITLIGLDRLDILELDFVEIFSILRVNHFRYHKTVFFHPTEKGIE